LVALLPIYPATQKQLARQQGNQLNKFIRLL